ncbi:MAG: bile acid:sodium symporter family protein [Gammaproteobacteria bacterium]
MLNQGAILEKRSVLLLPVGAVLISCFALYRPELLANYGVAIVPLLGLIMFSMGITLTLDDFKRVFKQPRLILLGVSLQYILMPLIAWGLAKVLSLPVAMAAGLILLGACPGGTASNVICYLARANVALSISLTAVSTLLAIILTPLITLLYVDQSLVVEVANMMKSLLFIVILPVLSGVIINTCFNKRIEKIKPILPVFSVLFIVFIIAVIVAKNNSKLPELGWLLFCAVVLHNFLGLMIGYVIPRFIGYDKMTCKTLAIEVGMQNSGLAVVLANQYFSAIAALPGALFSVWHNISGAILAAVWVKQDERA